MKRKFFIIVGVAVFLLLIGALLTAVFVNIIKKPQKNEYGYVSITTKEAEKIFDKEGDYIILDVRRADEFAQGHIPGAINVANEDIVSTRPAELPDLKQNIYVYCRSGRRSKEASAKLAAMGYENIIEFGGILDWNGETER